jgi:hypothetical protein
MSKANIETVKELYMLIEETKEPESLDRWQITAIGEKYNILPRFGPQGIPAGSLWQTTIPKDANDLAEYIISAIKDDPYGIDRVKLYNEKERRQI